MICDRRHHLPATAGVIFDITRFLQYSFRGAGQAPPITDMVQRLPKYWILCTVLIFAVLVVGCKEKKKAHEEKSDSLKSFLSSFLDNPNLPKDDRERIKTTLAKCENKTLGLEPVLLQAYIMKPTWLESPDMLLTIVDPNENVIGVGIREECRDSNCCWKTIEENYPVYSHGQSDLFNTVVIPLHIRTDCQKKDESAWIEYVNLDYFKLYEDYLEQQLKSTEISMGATDKSFWEESLPPVWVSRPEPNKLDVWVWVFNKAGNKSEPIKLINLVGQQNSEQPKAKY